MVSTIQNIEVLQVRFTGSTFVEEISELIYTHACKYQKFHAVFLTFPSDSISISIWVLLFELVHFMNVT